MPKRAPSDDTVDPVRSRLAASVATPAPAPKPAPEPAEVRVVDPVPIVPEAVGGGGEVAAADPQTAEPQARRAPSGAPRRDRPSPSRRPAPSRAPAISPQRPPEGAMRVNKKFLVSEAESERMEATLDVISQAFGSRVSYSQASRAVWSVLAIAEEAMAGYPRRGEPLRRPSKGDAIGMAEYEEALCDYLRTALKRV